MTNIYVQKGLKLFINYCFPEFLIESTIFQFFFSFLFFLIIFMITNHIENLHPALIRLGRIDFKIKFDYSTKDQIKQIMSRFFKDKILGNKINELIPKKKLIIIELQTYLMRYIYDLKDSTNHLKINK
ncbi:hypothetical protein ABK040_001165 [Willaertia magna]